MKNFTENSLISCLTKEKEDEIFLHLIYFNLNTKYYELGCCWDWDMNPDCYLFNNSGYAGIYLTNTPNIGRIFWTPLHYSVACNKLNSVKFLLSLPNLDINIKDCTGRTALEIAIHLNYNKKYQEMIELLTQHVNKKTFGSKMTFQTNIFNINFTFI